MLKKKRRRVGGSSNFLESHQYDVIIKIFTKFYSRARELYFENLLMCCISGLRVEHAPRVSWPAVVRANQRTACVKMSPVPRWTALLLLLCVLFLTVLATDSKEKPKKKKDIRDYNDADMARLLEQWEVRYFGAFLVLHVSFSANHSSENIVLRCESELYRHRIIPNHHIVSLL